MWNFIWLDIDSSLQTNDSKCHFRQFLWLDSDSTRPSHDSTPTWRSCDSDSTKMPRAHDWLKDVMLYNIEKYGSFFPLKLQDFKVMHIEFIKLFRISEHENSKCLKRFACLTARYRCSFWDQEVFIDWCSYIWTNRVVLVSQIVSEYEREGCKGMLRSLDMERPIYAKVIRSLFLCTSIIMMDDHHLLVDE